MSTAHAGKSGLGAHPQDQKKVFKPRNDDEHQNRRQPRRTPKRHSGEELCASKGRATSSKTSAQDAKQKQRKHTSLVVVPSSESVMLTVVPRHGKDSAQGTMQPYNRKISMVPPAPFPLKSLIGPMIDNVQLVGFFNR